MPELHVELEARGEGDAVEDVEAVDARAAEVAGPVAPRLIVIGMGERPRAAPAVSVVILGARAEVAGEGLAVDIDLLVALAPPALDGIIDEEGHAAEHALALGRQVVPVLHGPRADVVLDLPAGVKVHRASRSTSRGWLRRASERDGNLAVIYQADFRRFLKRHDPVAVHRAVPIDSQGQRLKWIDPRGGAEEVAQGGLDGLPAVEADLDDQRAQGRLDLLLGQVDSCHQLGQGPWTGKLANNRCLAGLNGLR